MFSTGRKIAERLCSAVPGWRQFRKTLSVLLGGLRRNRTRCCQSDGGSNNNGRRTRFRIFPESALAHKYCRGTGLEIGGSAQNPFGLNTLNVDMTDSMDTIFKKEEIRLCGRALSVDIVAGGDDIPLPDESQDFIVSSHVIEHFPNPIKALIEWDRLVRPGGIIFMIVPHKERTFDRDADCTSLEHLVRDFENNATEPHADSNSRFHDHRWVTETFVELIQYMIDHLGMKWEIAQVQDVDDKVGNGFTVVVRKVETHR
jgi:SAM-dependent methyltransferase